MHLCCLFSAAYTLSTKGVPQQSQSEPAKGSPLREKKGRMSENSWRGNLGRTGGFYQDADWYSANLRRKVTQTWQSNQLYFPYLVQMPLVGKMMEELVAALPPLGNSKVSNGLIVIQLPSEGFGPARWSWTGHHRSSGGLSKVGHMSALYWLIYYKYRARVSLLERCPQRVTQCKEAISRMVPPQKLEAVFQKEVSAVRLELGHDHDRWTFVTQVEKIFLEARTVSLLPPSPFTL